MFLSGLKPILLKKYSEPKNLDLSIKLILVSTKYEKPGLLSILLFILKRPLIL